LTFICISHFDRKLSFSCFQLSPIVANRRQINATACCKRILQSQLGLFFLVFRLQRQQSIDQAIKRSNERKLHRPCQSPYHEGRYGGMGQEKAGGGEPIDGQRWLLLAFRNDKTVKK